MFCYIWGTIADVAQLDRAFGYEPKGSRFESWHPQKKPLSIREGFLLFFYKVEKSIFPDFSAETTYYKKFTKYAHK